MPRGSEKETEKNGQLRQSCSGSSVRAPRPLLARKRNFFASSPQRSAKSPRGGAEGRGCQGPREPIGLPGASPPWPRDNNKAPAPGRSAEKAELRL